MTSFVCVGDVTQDNFFFINEGNVQCDIDQENCILALRYGQKIPVEKFGMACGGNAANVAVGLARLGVNGELLTTFGGDERGVWLKRELLRNNVNVENCVTDERRESNISCAIVFKGERTILSYHATGEDLVTLISQTPWIFLSSSSGKDSTKIHELVSKQKGQAKLAFNPSAAELRRGRDFLEPVLKQTDVLILNREEAEMLTGEASEIKETINKIAQLGPKIIAMTEGMKGGYVFDGQKYYFCEPFPGIAVETTGAGDAFSTGFLAAVFNGKEVGEAMRWGMANAASVVGKLGAQEGLLTMTQLEESLKKNHEQSTILV